MLSSRLTCRGVSGLMFGVAVCALSATAEEAEPVTELRADEVTVYGTSNPIAVFDYPGQVSVVSRDDIELLIPSTPSDLLRDVPGVDFSGGPRRTGEVPSIRGLSGDNVLILLDGARQSFISGHDGRFFIDPELISTVEVVRGPASSLYGSGAVGGVLAFETVDAADLLREGERYGARVRAGYQSVNEETFASFTAFGVQGNLDAVASLSLRNSGDIELGSGASLPSDDDISSGLVKLGYQFTEALRGELTWQGFSNSAIEPNNGQGTGNSGDPTLDRDVEKDIESDTFTAGLYFNPVSELINARLTVYQANNAVNEFDGTIPRRFGREVETTGVSLQNAAVFDLLGASSVFTIGGDWYEDVQTGRDDATASGTRGGVPNASAEFTGLYAQLETRIDQPFGLPGEVLLIPGVRYDSFESSSDTSGSTQSTEEFSPRFATSYGPVEWFRVFASYSEGLRAPSVNELYLDGTHFSVPHPVLFNPAGGSFVFVSNNFVPNANLLPETSETVEFGFGVDFHDLLANGDRLQGKVSRYESDVEDLINLSVDFAYDPTCFIAPTFFPCTAGTTYSDNVDAAEISGVEMEASYEIGGYFARLSYSSIEGTDLTTGADLGALSPDRLALNAGYSFRDRNLRVGTRVQYADDFEQRDGAGAVVETRESYAVVDLYASWQPEAASGVRLDFGVDNLFGEDYERVYQGVSEPGQSFKISASYQFGG